MSPSEGANQKVKTFFITSFGCRTNQADSASIRQAFLNDRYKETRQGNQADVIIVNSCTVTHSSDQQVRQRTRKLRRENPRARLIVTGCYAQREPFELARIPGVDAVVGNTHKNDLVEIANMDPHPQATVPQWQEVAAVYREDFRKVRNIEANKSIHTGGKTRPFVKIQDGCDAKCSYCIIPLVRGPSRSVPPGQVRSQVVELVRAGFKEIVLTGIHIGTYGRHLRPRYTLDQLLLDIISVRGLRRVRLSSIEPMQLSHRITNIAAGFEMIAPHFHICLQSGSDRILKKMRRPYNVARFADVVNGIHRRVPEASIGTDVIVGFPGETERDHQETVEFIESLPFSYLHVFPYSDRSGTPASRMQGKVPSKVKKQRSLDLRQLSKEKNRFFRRAFWGQELSVLTLSEQKEGMREAISGNYLKTRLTNCVPANEILTGVVTGEDQEGCLLLKV